MKKIKSILCFLLIVVCGVFAFVGCGNDNNNNNNNNNNNDPAPITTNLTIEEVKTYVTNALKTSENENNRNIYTKFGKFYYNAYATFPDDSLLSSFEAWCEKKGDVYDKIVASTMTDNSTIYNYLPSSESGSYCYDPQPGSPENMYRILSYNFMEDEVSGASLLLELVNEEWLTNFTVPNKLYKISSASETSIVVYYKLQTMFDDMSDEVSSSNNIGFSGIKLVSSEDPEKLSKMVIKLDSNNELTYFEFESFEDCFNLSDNPQDTTRKTTWKISKYSGEINAPSWFDINSPWLDEREG